MNYRIRILDHIRRHTAAGEKHIYSLILTPRTSTLVTQILEEEGVLGEISIVPYNLQFIPLEEDVLSLEHENAFKDIWAVRLLILASFYKLTFFRRMETKRQCTTLHKPSSHYRDYTASFLEYSERAIMQR